MANPLRLATESIAGQRPYQEDAVLAETLPDGRTLIAVADGMGGHAAGEVASALALEALRDTLRSGQSLAAAFRVANERVRARAAEPGKQGMGTTLVAALLDGDSLLVANVGDSRAYLVSAQGIRRLTEDHSFVAEAMRRGRSEVEAMDTPWRDALTRSVGMEGELEVDEFGPFPLEPDTALLMCSDGLYKTLGDQDLRILYAQSGNPERAARSLVSAAYDGGSDDNISVAIAEIGEVPRGDEAKRAADGAERPADGAERAADAEARSPEEDRTHVGPDTLADARVGTIAAVVLIALMLLSVLILG